MTFNAESGLIMTWLMSFGEHPDLIGLHTLSQSSFQKGHCLLLARTSTRLINLMFFSNGRRGGAKTYAEWCRLACFEENQSTVNSAPTTFRGSGCTKHSSGRIPLVMAASTKSSDLRPKAHGAPMRATYRLKGQP